MSQTRVITYELDDVWLLPSVSDPGDDPRQMTGTFEWTYEEGDFENGSGEFTSIFIPWYWDGLSTINTTFDTTSIEFTFDGNLHDRGLDITLFLLDPLSPTQPAVIDTARSRFQVEVGIIHEGEVISGSLVPIAIICPADFTGDGLLNIFDVLAFLDAFNAGDPLADFTADGVFDIFDLLGFLDAFNAGCP